ncbi:alpha/beta hydrolase (plasmid) [Prescottella equi]|uniref:alpha/beta fold hydrolase n=1 Tax=Rhodococcus hoagii TaxID=43767 RepID=UPI002576AF6D|nr:alpha/beta hydrolase [Prescottella equi]WJJ14458.1 alpha/beta hydrolase [Prescottella equi]
MAISRSIDLPALTTTYLEAGPADGPLAMVLHGFPDSPASWSETLDTLGDQGYRAVAPWLRGYAPSEIPADGLYQGGAFVRDIDELHRALGADRPAVLIGHDIGAAIAYGVAAIDPTKWERVVTISVPPAATLAQLMGGYPQLRKSWYTFLFQHPAAEAIIAADDYAFLDRLWEEWSPGFVHTSAVAAAKKALADPARLTAALGWYRAGFHPEKHIPNLAPEQQALAAIPTQPWLYLHGELDQCVGSEAADELEHSIIINGAGHFPHLEQPQTFRRHLSTFLNAGPTGTP